MKRAVFGSEVGAKFTPGFGALRLMKRPRARIRLPLPVQCAGFSLLALIAVAAIGHLH